MKSLVQHLDEYLTYAQASGQSPVHLRVLRFSVLRLLTWLEERYTVTEAGKLTPQHLEAWANYYSSRATGKGLPMKPTSISKQFQCDRAFLHWLGKIGVVPATYAEALPKIKLPHRLPTSVMTHKQVERLLGKIELDSPMGLQLRAMLEFLYSSGIRASELLGLNVQDVDLVARTARVLGKGSYERIVPFGPTAQKYLTTHLRAIRPLLLRDRSMKAVWLTIAGERMPYYTLRRMMVDLVMKAGLPSNVTPHTFRRSFTTELLRAEANPVHVQQLLGHKSLETLEPYTKLVIMDLKRTHAKCHPREKDAR